MKKRGEVILCAALLCATQAAYADDGTPIFEKALTVVIDYAKDMKHALPCMYITFREESINNLGDKAVYKTINDFVNRNHLNSDQSQKLLEVYKKNIDIQWGTDDVRSLILECKAYPVFTSIYTNWGNWPSDLPTAPLYVRPPFDR